MPDNKGNRGGYRHGTQWGLSSDELVTIKVPRYLKDRVQRLALELHQAVQESRKNVNTGEEE